MTKMEDYIQKRSEQNPQFAKTVQHVKNVLQGLDPSQAKRKLASIQEIADIQPIKNADRIVTARVLGWDIVVKKDEFNIGDKVVFFEIDSFLPLEDKYAFLGETRNNPIAEITGGRKEGYRVHTIKLRNQISQGLILGFTSFPDLDLATLPLGTDLTEMLNIEKFDRPEVDGTLGRAKGIYPSHIVSQTDELRVQSRNDLADDLKGQAFYTSLKYDGTSVTLIKQDGEITIASRNNTLLDGSLVHELFKSSTTWDKIKNYPSDFAIQGELYGPGLHSNRVGVTQKRFAVFNYVLNHNRQSLAETIEITNELGLEMVDLEIVSGPTKDLDTIKSAIKSYNKGRSALTNKNDLDYGLAAMPLPKFLTKSYDWTIPEAIKLSEALHYHQNGQRAEGMVVRNIHPSHSNEISFKVLNNKYLLKNDD